jgi:hypothetical protein
MFGALAGRAARTLVLCVACAISIVACHAKSQVVCDKLQGCGLLSGTPEECVDKIRQGFSEEGVDGEKLTKCIDCFGVKFCSEIRAGECDEQCSEVLEQLRQAGIIGSPAPNADAGGDAASTDQ